METDLELMELAARAAGIRWDCYDAARQAVWLPPAPPDFTAKRWWNPLTDDGDALRLAVKLRLAVHVYQGDVAVDTESDTIWQKLSECETLEEATRRAIVRAAAEIGKATP